MTDFISCLFGQVFEVLDEEVPEETQRERLATSDCCQQRQECLRTQVLQHSRE